VEQMREQARFADRGEAGRVLARELRRFAGRDDVVVLGLPRGGVPVAFEVARELRAPLDVFVVRKLGLPQQPELAMGALASGGLRVLNVEVVRSAGVTAETIERVARDERRELERREQLYRGDRAPTAVDGKTVVLIDDGLATGATMLAAVRALRTREPAQIVVAVPIAPPEACEDLQGEADEVVCARTPEPFVAIGAWYEQFPQTSDQEIHDLLGRASADVDGAD
jgi:putative phosphoribosyl transferase